MNEYTTLNIYKSCPLRLMEDFCVIVLVNATSVNRRGQHKHTNTVKQHTT